MSQRVSKREQRLVAELHKEITNRIMGGHLGQCDGCPAGRSYLCQECGLCAQHHASHGCLYSPHASEAYEPDDY